jgi:hypothetical protein
MYVMRAHNLLWLQHDNQSLGLLYSNAILSEMWGDHTCVLLKQNHANKSSILSTVNL